MHTRLHWDILAAAARMPRFQSLMLSLLFLAGVYHVSQQQEGHTLPAVTSAHLRPPPNDNMPWAPRAPPASVSQAAARAAAGCSAPAAGAWVPSRVSRGLVVGFPPLAVYHNVLLGACCARASSGGGPRDDACASRGSAWGETDAGGAVCTTHITPSRLATLSEVAARWRGCMSVAVTVCDAEDWSGVEAAWRADALLRNWVSLHALVTASSTPYPYNAARNTALDAVSGAAAHVWGAPLGTLWVVVADADELPSAPEPALRAILRAASTPGSDAVQLTAAESAAAVRTEAPQCAAHDAERLAPPDNCGLYEFGGMFPWALSEATTAEVLRRSRCATPAFDLSRTIFAMSSFDVDGRLGERERDAARELILGAAPGGTDLRPLPEPAALALATAAHARLACAFDVSVVHQDRFFLADYVGLLHWPAWFSPGAGFIPSHYSLGSEPYFAARAATLPRFDESFRGPLRDKQSFFTTLLAGGDAAHDFDLVHLPVVFLMHAKREGRAAAPATTRPSFDYVDPRYKPALTWGREMLQRYDLLARMRGDCADGCFCANIPPAPPHALRAAYRLAPCAGYELPPLAPAQPTVVISAECEPSTFLHAMDQPIFDMASSSAVGGALNEAECCRACLDERLCVAWVWRSGFGCFLKDGRGRLTTGVEGAIFGQVRAWPPSWTGSGTALADLIAMAGPW